MTTAYHPADALLYEFGLTSASIYIVRLLAYWILPASWAYVLTSACLISFINDNPWKLAPRGLGERSVQSAIGVTRIYSPRQSAIKGTYLESNPSSFFRISVLCSESSTDSAYMHNSGAWNDSVPAFACALATRPSSYSQNT